MMSDKLTFLSETHNCNTRLKQRKSN